MGIEICIISRKEVCQDFPSIMLSTPAQTCYVFFLIDETALEECYMSSKEETVALCRLASPCKSEPVKCPAYQEAIIPIKRLP